MNTLFNRKFLTFSFLLIALIGLCVLLIFWFWVPGTLRKEFNAGHRLGGDIITDLPENTLPLFRRAIAELEERDDYLFSECDLRETADGEIVIFHDWDLSKIVPDSQENRNALAVDKIGSQKINELTLHEVKSLKLENGIEIPTLLELLECTAELDLQKPLILEIKLLQSEAGRTKSIALAKRFRDQHQIEIHFSAFPRNIRRSFSDPRSALDDFQSSGFRVYHVYRPKTREYDMCRTWW